MIQHEFFSKVDLFCKQTLPFSFGFRNLELQYPFAWKIYWKNK